MKPRISINGTLLCLGCVFSLNEYVLAEDHPALQPVKELFAAMSEHDGNAMKGTATKDFQLLEHGEDWSMQTLIDAVQPKGNPYVRRNYFCQIRAEQKGDMAWVSYWNKAMILRDGKSRTIVWLESAVMVKEQNRWKVQMLHSTRVDPDKHPQDIQWVEHVAAAK
ncbi:MAG: nuclear transport factor 2 family protein [Aureliella sp.]